MPADEARRRSRWMIRALEWNDPRARYPNLWHAGLPRNLLALDTVASRLRLGDLVAVFHPSSQRYPERSERFVGLVRVVGLRRSDEPAHDWVDFEAAHRLATPLHLGDGPRRVFLCCDPGWPEREVALFRRVFDAAVAEGWVPLAEEGETGAPPWRPPESGRPARKQAGAAPPPRDDDEAASEPAPQAVASPAAPPPRESAERAGARAPRPAAAPRRPRERPAADPVPRIAPPAFNPAGHGRLFGGADYSADLRDARGGCWLALVELDGERLRVARLEPTARNAIQMSLRDADPAVRKAEAIGLTFPFGLPIGFSEKLLGGAFPEEGWWALAKHLDQMSLPDYLVALQEFRDGEGEVRRHTDDVAGGDSPLRRSQPDPASMAYHGIRMLAEERSRYAVRPFEGAKGRLLIEVSAERAAHRLVQVDDGAKGASPGAIIAALAAASPWPLTIDEPYLGRCLSQRLALDAVLAARCAAIAVLSGEASRTPEELAAERASQVEREGWIYGLAPTTA